LRRDRCCGDPEFIARFYIYVKSRSLGMNIHAINANIQRYAPVSPLAVVVANNGVMRFAIRDTKI